MKLLSIKSLLLGLVAIAFMSIPASAQVTSMLSASNGSATDTVVNTGTKSQVTRQIPGYQKVVTVVVTATKISGTVAGTAQLQGSLDGTSWVNVGSAFTYTDVASQTTSFAVTDVGWVYLRVLSTGSGTMSNIVRAKYLPRNAPLH